MQIQFGTRSSAPRLNTSKDCYNMTGSKKERSCWPLPSVGQPIICTWNTGATCFPSHGKALPFPFRGPSQKFMIPPPILKTSEDCSHMKGARPEKSCWPLLPLGRWSPAAPTGGIAVSLPKERCFDSLSGPHLCNLVAKFVPKLNRSGDCSYARCEKSESCCWPLLLRNKSGPGNSACKLKT